MKKIEYITKHFPELLNLSNDIDFLFDSLDMTKYFIEDSQLHKFYMNDNDFREMYNDYKSVL